jgi:drug/metabolite transporter (DMT)-like permease
MLPATRRDDIPRGILCMIVATVLFALMHALAKWQVGSYPVGEVMFFRSFFSLIVCAAVLLPIAGLGVLATRRVGAHMARGLSQSISQTCSVIAFSLMPLAGAIAINFSAPLWAALLSIVWLKECAGAVRWSVLLTGFCGVVIVANPGADAIQIGALFALANAVMYGSVTVAVRGMTATESTGTLMIWQMLTVAAFHCLLLPFGFRSPTAIDLALFAASGLTNVAAQYFWTLALRLGPAPAISPFYYLTLVWAVVIGYLGWGDVPTEPLLAGSAIVVLSGVFLLWHETRKTKGTERAGPATVLARLRSARASYLLFRVAARLRLIGAALGAARNHRRHAGAHEGRPYRI